MSPVPREGAAHGTYASAEDVRAVYAAAAAVPLEAHGVRMRITVADEADRVSAVEIVAALAERFGVGEPYEYGRRGGGAHLYLDVLVSTDWAVVAHRPTALHEPSSSPDV